MLDVGVLLPPARLLLVAEYCERWREGEGVWEEAPDMTPGGRPAMTVD